jgi:hypothetical protein
VDQARSRELGALVSLRIHFFQGFNMYSPHMEMGKRTILRLSAQECRADPGAQLTLAEEIPGTWEQCSTPNLLMPIIALDKLAFSAGETAWDDDFPE